MIEEYKQIHKKEVNTKIVIVSSALYLAFLFKQFS